MRATAIFVACLAAAPAVLATPGGAAQGGPVLLAEVLVPDGHVLEGRFERGRLELATSPRLPGQTVERALALGAECLNDVPSRTDWTSSFPAGRRRMPGVDLFSGDPVREGNLASRGACHMETFQGPVRWFQFHTRGNHSGSLHVTAPEGRFIVWCEGAGSASGAGAQGHWHARDDVGYDPQKELLEVAREAVTERSDVCRILYEGARPDAFSWWMAVVQNDHRDAGTATYAALG